MRMVQLGSPPAGASPALSLRPASRFPPPRGSSPPMPPAPSPDGSPTSAPAAASGDTATGSLDPQPPANASKQHRYRRPEAIVIGKVAPIVPEVTGPVHRRTDAEQSAAWLPAQGHDLPGGEAEVARAGVGPPATLLRGPRLPQPLPPPPGGAPCSRRSISSGVRHHVRVPHYREVPNRPAKDG